jgi:hypothetical protein
MAVQPVIFQSPNRSTIARGEAALAVACGMHVRTRSLARRKKGTDDHERHWVRA